jgi:thioredoxin 1
MSAAPPESLDGFAAYFVSKEHLPMSNPNVSQVSDASFDGDILKSLVPVLVDFWAPWCGPCRSVAPIVDDLANQYAGKIKVAKINVDESTEVAMRYQITSIPTFILFKNGEVADRALGALPKSEFVKLIDRNL